MNSSDEKTPHKAIRDWINQILEKKGWNPARLAREARVSPSTISRALNDERFVLTTRTIDKIRKSVEAETDKNIIIRQFPPNRFELAEGSRLEKLDKTVSNTFRRLMLETINLHLYRFIGNDLALYGLNSGDVVVIDQSEAGSICKRGDIAMALIASIDGVHKNTTLRYYDPPYLLTKNLSASEDSKPLPVDGETVKIIGRVVGLLRDFSR